MQKCGFYVNVNVYTKKNTLNLMHIGDIFKQTVEKCYIYK